MRRPKHLRPKCCSWHCFVWFGSYWQMGEQMCARVHTTKHKVEISVIWLTQPKIPHWKIQTKIKHFKAWLKLFAWGLSSLEVCVCLWCVCVCVITLPFLSPALLPPQCFHTLDAAFSLTCAIFLKGDILFPNITTGYNNSSQQLVWSHNTPTQDIHSELPYPTLQVIQFLVSTDFII